MPSIVSIKEVVPGRILSFGVPFKRFDIIPFGGRSTAIKLRDGSVFLTASHKPDEATKAALQGLGEVRYILALDAEHHLSLSEYIKLYPTAKLIGVHPLIEKRKDLKFDAVFGRDPEPLGELSQSGELSAEYFDSHRNADVAIYHADSKTLVQADLLFNLPPTEQNSKTNDPPSGFWPLSILINRLKPGTWLQRSMLNGIATDKAKFAASGAKVAEWDFDRIIPCHGDIIETGGKKAWLDTYANFLKPHQA